MSFKLALGQQRVCSVGDFIFLVMAYEERVASPLPHHRIFPLTVYSQRTHHS